MIRALVLLLLVGAVLAVFTVLALGAFVVVLLATGAVAWVLLEVAYRTAARVAHRRSSR